MNNEKIIELIEAIVEDESIPEEYRNELEWISYEDLQDGVDVKEVLENIQANYPADIYPAKLKKLFDVVIN